MISITKILGAAVAALLISALAVASAGAANFTAASYPVTVTETQSETEKFSVGGGSMTCKIANYSGSLTGASETINMNATYNECTAFGFIGATVTGFSSTGCSWHFGASGTASLACISGDVKIDAATCSVTLESSKNQGLKSVTYTNSTPIIGEFTKDKGTFGLHAVVTSGFGCPIAGGTYTNAAWTGKTVVLAKTSGGVKVSIDVG